MTLPYALRIATDGLQQLCRADPGFAHAVNMHEGKVTNQAVAQTFDMPYSPLAS